MNEPWVKVCGVTNVDDAEVCIEAGADAIGINFCPVSPRHVSLDEARPIAEAAKGRIEIVGVFVDAPEEQLIRFAEELGLDFLQLHGNERAALLQKLNRPAYKAVRVGAARDVDETRAFSGDRILVDAKVKGAQGGTGQTFDWALIENLVRERNVVLAGGLHTDNVREAVFRLRPFGVDTASGVEVTPRKKDERLVQRFVEQARLGVGPADPGAHSG